jgi:hypothetical protein
MGCSGSEDDEKGMGKTEREGAREREIGEINGK